MAPSAGFIVRRIYLAAAGCEQIPLGHLHILIGAATMPCRAPLRLAPGATCSSSLPRMFPAYAGREPKVKKVKTLVGRVGSNPRPADYGEPGPAFWARYLHTRHELLHKRHSPRWDYLACRSTNRSTGAAPDPVVSLLYVLSRRHPACIRAGTVRLSRNRA